MFAYTCDEIISWILCGNYNSSSSRVEVKPLEYNIGRTMVE